MSYQHPLDALPVLPQPLREGREKETKRDLYRYFPRAWALAQSVALEPTPFTVGVAAEWGRGKSTFLNTVRWLLEAAPTEWRQGWGDVRVLSYEPWRFRIESFEDVWLSLTADLARQIKGDEESEAAIWSEESRLGFLKAAEESSLLERLRLLGGLGGLPWVGKPLEAVAEYAERKEQESAPPHLYFRKNRDALRKLCAGARPTGTRILLLVDDLDRCEPGIALEILRAVHVFARCPNLVCMLALDRDVVLRRLAQRYGSDSASLEQAMEYLHKIIPLTVTPPRVSEIGKEILVEALVNDKETAWEDKGYEDTFLSGSPPMPLDSDYSELRKEPLRSFVLRSLCYNPRTFERFKLIYDFRWSVLPLERPGRQPLALQTAAQAVIELRWPLWNCVAYRFPRSEKAFKTFMRKGKSKPAEKTALLDRYPRLAPFLKNQELCRFYRKYYELKAKL